MNALIVYYSQTGQLKEILRNLFSDSMSNIDYCEIQTTQYKFPLTWKTMFDMFPESVLQKPCSISYELPHKDYDAVILGFQTWFLHLSLPMLTFCQTCDFNRLVEGKKVYLIMDCRNSWGQAMQFVENRVKQSGGVIEGKYVYGSTGGNFVGSISILHWFFTGNKKVHFLPEPGVPQIEIDKAHNCGDMILSTSSKEVITFPIGNSRFMPVQMENFAIKKFKWWAKYIINKDNKYRKYRLLLFRLWLICTLMAIAPFTKIMRCKC